MDSLKRIIEYISKIKISFLTFIITFLIFYFLSDRILMNLFWNFIDTYPLALLSTSYLMNLAIVILSLTITIALVNILPVFIFEMVSLLDQVLSEMQKKIGMLKVILYAIYLNAVGLVLAYWIVFPMFLDGIVKTNAKYGLQTFIEVDKFIHLITLSIIISSFIAQIPFIIWIGIKRIEKISLK